MASVFIAAQVGAGGVDHHRGVDAVEGPGSDHEDLAAAALLGRGAQDHDPSAAAPRPARRRRARAEPGGGDDVVPAGVADAGQGVVLAQHGDGRARAVPARASNAVSRP